VLPDHESKARRAFRAVTRAALAVALSASLVAPSSAYAQSDEEKAAARALAKQGAEALNNKKFAEALDFTKRAESIFHAPTHLLLIGRAQVGLGKLVAAQETFLKLSREELAPSAPEAFKNAQAAAKEELAAIEPKIASLRIVLDNVGTKTVTVKLDDVIVPPALVGVHRPIDPGKHEVGVYPVGGSPAKTSVELKDGEKKEIKVVVPDGPPPSGVPVNPADNPDAAKPADPGPPTKDHAESKFMTPLRGAGIGVGAVGLAGLVVGSIFVAKGFSTQSSANALADMYDCHHTGKLCLDPTHNPSDKAIADKITQQDSDAAKQKTIGVIGLGVGAAALAGGVALIVVGKPKPAAPAKASVEPWFDGSSVGLRGSF
jgi:hypothetical protein